jgi:hypothetical protein
MTMNDGTQDRQLAGRENDEPTEIEALLPWYAAGTLRRRDRQRVEAALHNDPNLARHAELVREELAETICLNESLGAPSVSVMDRLMAAIDAEALAAHKRGSPRAVAGRFGAFIAGFSPRTLAFAASIAMLAIGLEAFFLVGILTKPQGPAQAAGLNISGRGPFAMVRFARQASAGEITSFLQNYQATLVDGPRAGGLYRVRIGVAGLAKEEIGRIVSRMRQDRVVEYASAD